MNKRELLGMRPLNATPKMMRLANVDKLEQRGSYYWSPNIYERTLYLRCLLQNEILKVSLFLPEYMRAGSRRPRYDLYLDRANRKFLTYDVMNQKWLTSKLDRLDWPYQAHCQEAPWLSNQDAARIKTYLGDQYAGCQGILEYQKEIREEALEARHRRETAAWDEDLTRVPPLPKDWERWVDKVGIRDNYLFYHYKKGGAKQGFCTFCGKEVPIKEKPRHNEAGRCACCRHEVTYKALGRISRLMTDRHDFYLLQRCRDGFVLREFYGYRYYTSETYRVPDVRWHENQRFLYDQRLNCHPYYWGDYKQRSLRWIAGTVPYSYYGNCHIGGEGRIYGKTLPTLSKNELQRTGLVYWLKKDHLFTNPKRYLTIVSDVPQAEQIWKANLPQLTQECLRDSDAVRTRIKDRNATELIKALGLTPRSFRRLREHNGGCDYLDWLHYEKESGKATPDELIDWFKKNHITVANLCFIRDRMSAVQVKNYMQRQMKELSMTAWEVLNTWADYLSMAKQLGIDTSDEIVYRVKLLRQRHDELAVRMKQRDSGKAAAEVLKKFPQVDEICRSLKEKFEYINEKEAYMVTAPTGALDIIVEGRMLNHCLSGSDRYWDRIQRHESYILFLRRSTAPHLPYYTLEVEPDGTVRQKRTQFDRQGPDIEEIKDFLARWQKVVAGRLDKTDRERSKKSRALRFEELQQMRKDRVVIRTGDLAGHLLADVLAEDLMETAA